MAEHERGRRDDGDGRPGIALAGENVEDDVGGVDAVGERFGAGRLDRRQPVGEHGNQDVDHLPIAVIGPGQLAPHALHGSRQHPGLEGSAVAQSAWLAGEHRDVMPGIVDRRAAAKRARMRSGHAP